MEALLFIALSIFASREKTGLPEVALAITKQEDAIRLLNLLAGQTVSFPTKTELSLLLQCALAVYHIQEEGRTWAWVQQHYQWGDRRLGLIQLRYDTWVQYVEKNNLDLHKIFESMK